jgi:hypothetical protein
MPSTLSVNMQQVLQMGTHSEKIQHTLQSLPNINTQMFVIEQHKNDELKRKQVNYIEPSYLIEETRPQTFRKKRVSIHKKNQNCGHPVMPQTQIVDMFCSGKINIII